MRGALLVAGLALLAFAPPTSGQSLIPERGLDFGRLTPGVPSHVSSDDPNAASITIFSLRRVSIRLISPAPMVSPAGGSIPLTIGMGDAVVRWLFGGTDVLVPGAITEVRGGLIGSIRIGGTASPSWNQGAGDYTSTIILQVVAPGT